MSTSMPPPFNWFGRKTRPPITSVVENDPISGFNWSCRRQWRPVFNTTQATLDLVAPVWARLDYCVCLVMLFAGSSGGVNLKRAIFSEE